MNGLINMRKYVLSSLILGGILAIGFYAWFYPKHSGNQLTSRVNRILHTGERFELLSTYPYPVTPVNLRKLESFHDFKILGQIDIRDRKKIETLLQSLEMGIRNAPAQGASCFHPRHGIRVTHGEEKVDLLICFECGYIYEFGDAWHCLRTNDTPAALFNQVLEENSVPTSKD